MSVIWSEIIRVISKSNERAARVRFEITSMISDQNCVLHDPKFASNLIAYNVITRTTKFWSVLNQVAKFAKLFLTKMNHEPFDVRLHKLNLLTLEQRRFVDDVTFLFKALSGHLDVAFSQFLDFYSQEDRYLLRHFDNKSLKKKYARTNILKNSYFYRIVDEWNSLPLEVRSACNVKPI